MFAGGDSGSRSNVIDYIAIDTTGNATDFGNLTVARFGIGATSDGSRGVFGGGQLADSSKTDVIDYITIANTGNATDFGDLEDERYLCTSTSGT